MASKSMEQRIALLTLGVRDLAKSTAFLERLGWRRSVRGAEGASFFQCGSIALSLFPRSELAKDAGILDDGAGFGRFSIAHNARSKDEVDAVLAEARSAGAEVIKPARNAPWGGYAGYFRDLDGFLWEVAWNPDFPLDATGAVQLPE
jgi:catechol 2,3-dioxygenase-like lactoylglutathione lyase family enzyme